MSSSSSSSSDDTDLDTDIDIEPTHEHAHAYPLKSNKHWADVTPVPLSDNNIQCVSIQYSNQYDECTTYLRAIIAKDERSLRGLYLTKQVIQMNAAHYTAWCYRRMTLFDLCQNDISAYPALMSAELDWINQFAQRNTKSYQLWQHRRSVVQYCAKTNSCNQFQYDVKSELEFTENILDSDSKNYHAWSHRQHVLHEFADTLLVYDNGASELAYVDSLIVDDVRNNSAWTQRYFVIKHTRKYTSEVITSELTYSFSHIHLTINNDSPYNYVLGLLYEPQRTSEHLQLVVQQCKQILERSDCRNARSLLVECYNMTKQFTEAIVECNALKQLDLVRKPYWIYRVHQLTTRMAA